MQRAGAAAAAEIVLRFGDVLERGVVVATDRATTAATDGSSRTRCTPRGSRVRVVECVAARTPGRDRRARARASRRACQRQRESTTCCGGENIVVDALLGTGLTADGRSRATSRRPSSNASRCAARRDDRRPRRADRARREHGQDVRRCAVRAHRHLRHDQARAAHRARRVRRRSSSSTSGSARTRARPRRRRGSSTRRGSARRFRPSPPTRTRERARRSRSSAARREWPAPSMLAARAALRSGAGMVKCVVAPESLQAVQEAEPAALAAAWPTDDAALDAIANWADAMLIGPGSGAKRRARDGRARCSRVFDGPVVLDADALNAFARDLRSLARTIGGRAALLTPHPAEFGRLVGLDVDVGAGRAIRAAGATRGAMQVRRCCSRACRRSSPVATGTVHVVARGNADARDGRRGRRARRDRRDAARPHRRRGDGAARSPRSRTGAPRRR